MKQTLGGPLTLSCTLLWLGLSSHAAAAPPYHTTSTPKTVENVLPTYFDGASQSQVDGFSEFVPPQHFASPIAASVPDPISPGPYRNQLAPYRDRVGNQTETPSIAVMPPQSSHPQSPSLVGAMWWEGVVNQPLGLAAQTRSIDVGSLAQISLASSPYVQGLLTEPKIRSNDMVIADAEFDSLAFIDGKFSGANDPVGSTLTTGDSSTRFRDDLFTSSLGVRKRSRSGGNVSLLQRGGFQSNNSTFLIPNSQGTSRLELNYTQPLMRDRGRAVNMTSVVLASINIQLTRAEVRAELEDHLVDVTRAYWELYQSRAEYLQRQRLVQSAVDLHDKLQARSGIDSQQRQILRAEVALTRRRSELVRIENRIRNAQSRLRMLTGDAYLIASSRYELLPEEQPVGQLVTVSTRSAMLTALDHRPDIAGSLRKVQAVATKVGAARNQVLPRLDLLLSSYVAGLDSRSDTFGAIGRQFTEGGPSYAAGLQFEMPIGNRAAEARLQRNRWELTRSIYEFQQTTEAAITNVEIAVRETQTAYAEMIAKRESVAAATREVEYLQQRWQWLPDPNESAVLLIEDLLDAQERVADEEQAVSRAQVAYALSWIGLRKATGTLLQVQPEGGESFVEFSDDSVPEIGSTP